MTLPPLPAPGEADDDTDRRLRDDVTIGILAALPVEGAAMMQLIDDVRPAHWDPDPHRYQIGTIPSSGGRVPHRVAMALLSDDGTNQAAASCVDMLRTFPNVRTVIVVGIAGGIPRPLDPGRHVRLGDIVVANDGIVDYGHVRQVDGARQLRRRHEGMISPLLRRTARELEMVERAGSRSQWQRWLDPELAPAAADHPRPDDSTDVLYSRGLRVIRPDLGQSGHRRGVPKIHHGLVGSADILMRDEDARDDLGRQFPDLVAVEMEGSGIAASTAEHGAHWFMVRGIADYCETTGKNDVWHSYASFVAAVYVRSLLESTPPLPRALPLVPTSERDRIIALLRQVSGETDLRAVWHTAVSDVPAPPPRVFDSADQIFLYLSSRNADETGQPPAVRFVQTLAGDLMDVELAARLRQWLHSQLPSMDAAAAGKRFRPASGEDPAEPCLLIEITADGIDRESCRITSYIQDRTGPWKPHAGPGDAAHVRLADAAATVGELIEYAEREEWRHSADGATIEFLLPVGLLNLPVEWWNPPAADAEPIPLCVDYPVVVRSLERMHHNRRPRIWGNRWKSLNVGRVQWGVSPRTEEQLNAWQVQLRADQTIATVVLSGPPDQDSGLDELKIAIAAGVPVILWDRRAPRPVSGDEALDNLIQGNPAQIPARTRDLRARAAEVPESRRPRHPGAFVALLWDNPNRVIAAAGRAD